MRVKLAANVTWDGLASMTPDAIKSQNLWPAGFLPLPHPHHEAGGMIFPKVLIDETKRQTERDLSRFDLDFDLPDHLLPEATAAIYLTTRPDLGDVSKGQLVTLSNFHELFKDVFNPRQLEGLRLLVTPFPQQQFNATEDRRSLKAHQGVACFDCHANGHTNAATHIVGDIRPNEHRHRIDTPTLRGVTETAGFVRCDRGARDRLCPSSATPRSLTDVVDAAACSMARVPRAIVGGARAQPNRHEVTP